MWRELLQFVFRPLAAYCERHLVLYLDLGGDAPPPPDYKPVADASKEAAEIGAQLGREQLDEARRQYDQNMAVARPVVDAQLEVMRQGIRQGDDYYDYGKSFRPLEQQMMREAGVGTEGINAAERLNILDRTTQQANALSGEADAFSRQQATDIAALRRQQDGAARRQSADARTFMADQTGMANQLRDRGLGNEAELRARAAAFDSDVGRDIRLATGGRGAILDAYRDDIDADVGRAVADARTGQTQALNSALRQAMRYGLSVPSNAQQLTYQNAAQLAAAANNTRTNAIDSMRNVIRDGIGLKSNTFQVGQSAVESAMNRGESAMANRMAAGRDTFVIGQSALSDADNRRLSAGTTAIGQSADAFRTGTAARTSAFDRELTGLSANRNMGIQDRSLDWARKLDVTGMARGMPGASQGAYGVAVGAGNSATQNQMAPGQALVGAMGQSNATQMQGRQLAMQGLTGILNSQTSAYNAGQSAGDGLFGAVGTIAGAGITAF
jgi:hypothetical protein